MSKRMIPLLPIAAVMLLLLLVILRNSQAGLWVAISALLAASAWTFQRARRSWVVLASEGASRLQDVAEFIHYCFLCLGSLAIIAVGIMWRIGINTAPIAIVFAVMFVAEFATRAAIQIKLAKSPRHRHKTTPPDAKGSKELDHGET